MNEPKLLSMLCKCDIDGDDALIRLGQAYLTDMGVGAELYPQTPTELSTLLEFLPEGRPATAHLPRALDVLDPTARERIVEFANAGGDRLFGLTLHDQSSFAGQPRDLDGALETLDRALRAARGRSKRSGPAVYLENSGALREEAYVSIFERTRKIDCVRACVDVGHAGLKAAQQFYAESGNGDIFALTATSSDAAIFAIQNALREAAPRVLAMVESIARLGKPMHFHLHDAHPLSRLSPYGVSDHLSFLQTIPIPFAQNGLRIVGGMFGPAGLRAIVAAARRHLAAADLSFLLEIHPQYGRRPLGRHEELFRHWTDHHNAERMAFWLEAIGSNLVLLRDAWAAAEVVLPQRGVTMVRPGSPRENEEKPETVPATPAAIEAAKSKGEATPQPIAASVGGAAVARKPATAAATASGPVAATARKPAPDAVEQAATDAPGWAAMAAGAGKRLSAPDAVAKPTLADVPACTPTLVSFPALASKPAPALAAGNKATPAPAGTVREARRLAMPSTAPAQPVEPASEPVPPIASTLRPTAGTTPGVASPACAGKPVAQAARAHGRKRRP